MPACYDTAIWIPINWNINTLLNTPELHRKCDIYMYLFGFNPMIYLLHYIYDIPRCMYYRTIKTSYSCVRTREPYIWHEWKIWHVITKTALSGKWLPRLYLISEIKSNFQFAPPTLCWQWLTCHFLLIVLHEMMKKSDISYSTIFRVSFKFDFKASLKHIRGLKIKWNILIMLCSNNHY